MVDVQTLRLEQDRAHAEPRWQLTITQSGPEGVEDEIVLYAKRPMTADDAKAWANHEADTPFVDDLTWASADPEDSSVLSRRWVATIIQPWDDED